MTSLILRIYDLLGRHRRLTLAALLALTGLMALLVGRISFHEDISDFLPLDANRNNALKAYQQLSGAERLFVVFGQRDSAKAEPDSTVAAIDDFVAITSRADKAGWTRGMTSQVDMEQMDAAMDFVYKHIPYFLTANDYRRIDSLLAQPGYVGRQLEADKQLLLFPSGGMAAQSIGRDPLGLFTPVVERLRQSADNIRYELYDGYVFSPDMQRAVVTLDSPFGSSETENNGHLLALLHECFAHT